LAEASAVAGVHPVYLSRAFRRIHGKTMGEYVHARRIRYSCERLAHDQESLAEIAGLAGFTDQSHFSRIFKSALRMTPGEFRRSTTKSLLH